jgi:Holliday junction resolvase RusA-like endonuclease
MIAHEITTVPFLKVFVAGKPVSVNLMYEAGSGGKKYGKHKSKETQAWQAYVWYEVARARAYTHGHRLHLPLRIEMEFFQVKGDADNYGKATQDAIAQALDVDDRHFTEVTVRRAAWVPRRREHGKWVAGRTQGAMLTVWEAS